MNSPASYVGGKRVLANELIAIFPPHQTYVEVFGGGLQVLFRKPPSAVEVANDLDGEITNLFRVIKEHHAELVRYFSVCVVGRKWFDLLKATDPATLTDVQRAGRYLYLLKNSFASLVRNPTYHINVVQKPGFNLERLPQLLENAQKRLARVQIENLPYEQILRRYDRPTTLFYCDPPYWNRRMYRYNFTAKDFATLAGRLAKLRGKFVVSLNDVPEVRDLFKRFHIRGVELPYTAQKASGRRFREVVITNFS